MRMVLTINKKVRSDFIHEDKKLLELYREAWCHAAYHCRGTFDAQCYILPEEAEKMKEDGIAES